MPKLAPDATESEQRIAMAAAHRTVATIYDDHDLPLPALPWNVSKWGDTYAYFEHLEDLDAFASWLDDARRDDSTSETHAHHWVHGSKEDVEIMASYHVKLTADPLP